MRELSSQVDASKNFILPGKGPGEFLECRYVRRTDSYIGAYLSSAYGCPKGCGMCHLTLTKQQSTEQVTWQQYVEQAQLILEHYKQLPGPLAEICYFNFMARGEPLDNPDIRRVWIDVSTYLAEEAEHHDLYSRFNISTIMPRTLGDDPDVLIDMFGGIVQEPVLYYSLYSDSQEFRDKWLPGAMPVDQALKALKHWQDYSKKLVKIHYALIKGENDVGHSAMIRRVLNHGIQGQVNLVPFNPGPGSPYEEATDQYAYVRWMWEVNGFPCKIKDRVGPDVYASCGMFAS